MPCCRNTASMHDVVHICRMTRRWYGQKLDILRPQAWAAFRCMQRVHKLEMQSHCVLLLQQQGLA